MKTFKTYLEEEGIVAGAANSVGSGNVSLPPDANYAAKPKRKRRPLTRNYIEVNGKIKKRTK